jgi:hypothetical protein
MSEPEPIEEPSGSPSPIKHQHPELYGKLLEVDKALQDAGAPLLLLYLILVLVVYCGLWFGWYKIIPGLEEVDLGVCVVYALVGGVFTAIWLAHCNLRQRRCYQQHREEIVEFLHGAGLSRYQLLTDLEGDKSLRDVSDALKRDRGP